jgi:hypothetical protein
MTIFAVLLPEPQPLVVQAIKEAYPNDSLSISDTQWLVSGIGTAVDVCAKLKIFDVKNPTAAPSGAAIVFATSGYFGRAPANIWEWIKAKLEVPPNG